MKLVSNNRLAAQRGTTLIELSVVIAVILLLVGVLFVGISGWKNAANKSACVMNISTIQKAMRSWSAANSKSTGDACDVYTDLAAAGYFSASLACPSSSASKYTSGGKVVDVGNVYASCAFAATDHKPAGDTTNW